MKRQLESTIKEKQSQKGFCAFAAMVVAGGTFAAMALIPAPREMDVQGGECQVKAPPKVEAVATIPSEGYELSIAPDGVTIRHSDGAGLFYAKKTLEQLATKNAKGNPTSYPCVEIKDAPAFRWRGVMLDEARHFFGKVAVKQILERMAFYKLNVFHWHLTDDQAWRIDIPGYPDLARLGTYRTGMCESEAPLFYSANDIREIVEYAKARHITIVPEIDFPGHFGAAVRAYPWLACPKGKKNVMCLGNPDAVRFAEKVIDGVCELFPGEVIHIGGDECPASSWAKCRKCKAFMKREGIGELKGMQPWLTRHLAKYLKSKGKRVSGWEEIAVGLGKLDKWGESENLSSLPENMLPPNDSLVMGYHTRPAALAANIGYEVVSCPTWHCYFDYSQKIQDDPHLYHRPDIRWCPLDAAFNYDPYECVNPDARNRIVGVECCNWAGKTRNVTELEWKMWPRTFAFAEVAWRNEEPAKRDFAEFLERAAVHRARLIREHVNCAPLK